VPIHHRTIPERPAKLKFRNREFARENREGTGELHALFLHCFKFMKRSSMSADIGILSNIRYGPKADIPGVWPSHKNTFMHARSARWRCAFATTPVRAKKPEFYEIPLKIPCSAGNLGSGCVRHHAFHVLRSVPESMRIGPELAARECLDHIVVTGEQHLRHILQCYLEYYNAVRTHLSFGKDAPIRRVIHSVGRIEGRPVLGGLHHQYVRI
jgi:hypothetical protein